jgi:uncharacterized protein YbjT (DUF2867 family)
VGKTAVVIGATGLVGKALVDQLAQAPHVDKVIAVTRRHIENTSPKVANEVVDFDQLQNHASAFSGDFLFSCLGTTIAQAGSIEAQRKVDFDYQLNAARLAANCGVERYLLVSSAGAKAKSNNPYLKMKGELEEEVLKLPFKRISIFQPSLLLGERNHFRPAEKVASLIVPVIALIPGLRRFRGIRGDQVARKMVEVSRTAGPAREVFKLDEVFPSA